MKVDATDLHRMCYNAAQFSDKDSSVGGVTLWATDGEALNCWATDDYVALRDSSGESCDGACDIHGHDQYLWGLELKALKQLEKELREVQGDVFIELLDSNLQVLQPNTEEDMIELPTIDATETMSPVVKIIEQSEAASNIFAGPFAIRQNRFTKFRLLKTPGDTEYPVDFIQGLNPQGVEVLLWKLGPHLRGVVGQVDREYLAEYFAERGDVLW